MWLLNVQTIELRDFIGTDVPPYAILSHTWGSEEVSFVELKKAKYREQAKHKAGFSKIAGCCARAKKDGYDWAWVDSCCIDKRSSAELSEAINSMFAWYKRSKVCYIYLSDVRGGYLEIGSLAASKWFTRGWTLQELLAPSDRLFFAHDWTILGYIGENALQYISPRNSGSMKLSRYLRKAHLTRWISQITQIPESFISGRSRLEQACVSQRMFWASHRRTTRPEDWAYSLMGLFDINMPILYGEGLEKAFMRLQQEILSTTPDQSIFAWHYPKVTTFRLLANSPGCFRDSKHVKRSGHDALGSKAVNSAFHMTNLGLKVTLPICSPHGDGLKEQLEASLLCYIEDENGKPQQLSLNLSYLDTEMGGRLVYMCRRRSTWTFRSGNGIPTSIFIRGIDLDAFEPAPLSTLDSAGFNADNVVDHCLGIISSFTDFKLATLHEQVSFKDMSADSMVLLNIMSQMKHSLGVEVVMKDFHTYPTIGKFTDFLILRLKTREKLSDSDELCGKEHGPI